MLIVLASLFIVYRNEIIHGYNLRSFSKTLPHISENFVGREDEIQELLARVNFKFSEIRIINIVGSPGFGKSTLAMQLGHKLVDQGVYVHYVNMEDLLSGSIEQVLAEKILKSSGISAKTVTFDKLLQWARDRSGYTLLILDNCDNVLRGQLSKNQFILAVRNLVQTSTRIKTIMTSRKTVVHTEHYTWYKVYQLSPKAAISLLDNKLPKLKLLLKEKEEISELTGNVPLALHIVGSLLMLEDPPSPNTIIEELKSNPVQFLSPKKLPIQLRIDASISLSYRYLDDDLKEVALFLALFPGSFSKGDPIDISKGLHDIKLSNSKCTERLSVSQIELGALVDRSLLEYNERGGRYQYHRLIREFLSEKMISDLDLEAKGLVIVKFYNGFTNHFLKKLHLNTVDFKFRYVNSLKFLDTERHNIYTLLKSLSDPASLSRHSLLMTINYVTLAIDAGYLTCRFTSLEMVNFLLQTVNYLDGKMLEFLARYGSKTITDLTGNTWTQREYYQRIYIQLLITYSDLLAKTNTDKFALRFMESRESIVRDLLSVEKSLPDFQSSSQQYESHKQQYEPQPSSQSNRVQAPDSVPLSTKEQRQIFYHILCARYLAQGQHSKVIECHLKILEDAKRCKQEKCSYQEIGYMYYNIDNYVKAAMFFELSLKNDGNNLMSEQSILLTLLKIYRKWLGISKEEEDTLNRLTSVCHKLMKEQDDLIFYNWKNIIATITTVNENVDFLEERLFTIMSTPNTEFQLKPKDALEVVQVFEQANNYTKTVLWGSLLLQPFEDYNDLSVEENINVLRIYELTSKAKINLKNFSEGLDGMEHVYKTIEQSLELQNHNDTHAINSRVCFYLIVRLKYVIPCYRDYLKDTTAGIITLFSSSIYNLPMNLAYIVFVVPFEFRSKIKFNNNGEEVKSLRPSTAVVPTYSKMFGVDVQEYKNMFGIQIVEDIVFTVVTDLKYMVQSAWTIYDWHLYQMAGNFFRFSINVITVAIRFWILCALFAIISTVPLILCTLFLENILAPMYMSVALSPILPQSAREIFIALCDFFIFSSKVQVQLLQNQVGFSLLFSYTEISQLNLAQLYPFDYEHHLDTYYYKNKFFYIVSLVMFSLSMVVVIIVEFIVIVVVILITIIPLRFSLYCSLFKRRYIVFFILAGTIIFCCIYLLL